MIKELMDVLSPMNINAAAGNCLFWLPGGAASAWTLPLLAVGWRLVVVEDEGLVNEGPELQRQPD